ncbi:MAG: glycine zipper 2TM domain-containing protein [Gammaproteobacteria bacterium]|nr:glycine zipper 2TM domain-containing protein [Gammaproteobacteria bacterium]
MLTARILKVSKPVLLAAMLMPALVLADHGNARYGRAQYDGGHYDRAKVVAVEPLYETVTYDVPREQCYVERAPSRYEGRHGRSATAPIVGAIIGGALGNAVGHKKRNKQVGTVVGAILGGSIGADIRRRNHGNYQHVSYRDQQVCRVVSDTREEERLLGYRVTYRYAGETYTTRMDRDPGPSLRVRVRVSPA